MKTITVRIDDNVLDRVDGLAIELSRSRSWVINQAIKHFLEYEEWFIQEVKDGLREVENGEIVIPEEAAAQCRNWVRVETLIEESGARINEGSIGGAIAASNLMGFLRHFQETFAKKEGDRQL